MKRAIKISVWLAVAALIFFYASSPARAQVWEEWVARYDGPRDSMDVPNDIALDDDGNVFVTGMCDFIYSVLADYDYATIKYNSDGTEQWVAIYNGPADNKDHAKSLATGPNGTVYVTGFHCGNLGLDNYEYATVKYDGNGNEQWVATYCPEGGKAWGKAIAVDANGNAFVTGAATKTLFPHENYDYNTIKYNSEGVEQWTTITGGQANANDWPESLETDTAGNVYVTGRFRQSLWNNINDYATVKYSPIGIEQWVATYNGPANSDDYAYDLAVDADGSSYVTGWSDGGTETGIDYATIKYDSAGVRQWVARYNGPESDHDYASSLALDVDGNVYVTGRSPGIGTNQDFTTVKYNSDGVEQWVVRYNGPANGWDEAKSIASDRDGNLYVTGLSYGGYGPFQDYATVKYDSAGVEQWVIRYDGTGNCSNADWAVSIIVDNDQNVYVTGKSDGLGTSEDYLTVKYSQSGPPTPVVLSIFNAAVIKEAALLIWQTASEIDCYGWRVERRQGEGQYQDVSPLIPGHGTTEEPHDYSFIDLTAQPNEIYEYRLEQIDLSGSITFSDPITVSLPPLTTTDFHLYQNSPNPFNEATVITFELPVASFVKLEVFDICGRSQESPLQNGWLEAGHHEVTFDGTDLASGIYIYRLEAGKFAGTGKMVLLK